MEFVDVMKQKRRMCRVTICENCPLFSSNNGTNSSCAALITYSPEKAEEIIMKWVEEHPAKTNEDKFNEVFPNFPIDIREVLKECRTRCVSYPRCEECGRKKAIDFWKEEYKEVSKDADSN